MYAKQKPPRPEEKKPELKCRDCGTGLKGKQKVRKGGGEYQCEPCYFDN